MKKQRSVKIKLNKLIQALGSREAVAKTLGIHVSYISKMLKDVIPGKRLYRDICKAGDDL